MDFLITWYRLLGFELENQPGHMVVWNGDSIVTVHSFMDMWNALGRLSNESDNDGG